MINTRLSSEYKGNGIIVYQLTVNCVRNAVKKLDIEVDSGEKIEVIEGSLEVHGQEMIVDKKRDNLALTNKKLISDQVIIKFKCKIVGPANNYDLEALVKYDNKEQAVSNTIQSEANVLPWKKITTGEINLQVLDCKQQPVANCQFDVVDHNNLTICQLATSQNGDAHIKQVPFGTYLLVQTASDKGYLKNDKPLAFAIDEVEPNAILNIINLHDLKTMRLVNIDINEQGLSEAEFVVIDENEKIVETLITDELGNSNEVQLREGNYHLLQKRAAYGYQKEALPIAFNTNGHKNELTLVILNYKLTGKARISINPKSNEPKEDVEFLIINASGRISDRVKTNEEGVIVSKDLPLGYYCLVASDEQKTRSSQYITQVFQVSKNNQVVEVVADSKLDQNVEQVSN